LTENEQPERRPSQPAHLEEKGVVVDAIVTVAATGIGSGVGAYIGGKLAQQPPPQDPPPPPPAVELPPGVDRD
jgi:hypothetical protein